MADDPLTRPQEWRWTHASPGASVGWRLWRVEDGALVPLTVTRVPWSPGVNVARCLRGDPDPHDAPAWTCQCGFWALREREAMERYLADFRSAWYGWIRPAPAVVWGQVVLWGTVITCEHGWRASHARPVGIAADPPLTDGLAARGFVVVPPSELC